jgi:hypothetical protein
MRLSRGRLLSAAPSLAISTNSDILFLLIRDLVTRILAMLASRHPAVTVALEGLVLATKINTALSVSLDSRLSSLAESAGATRQAALDDGGAGHPVGQGVFAVLDDGLAGLVAVVGGAGLAGSHGVVVDQLEEMGAVAGDNGELLAVLTHGVELVGEGSLELLTSDVAELSFGDQRLGFSADEFLLENDDAGRVWFLVLKLGDLVGDLLLAVTAGLDRGLDVADRLHCDAVLVVAVDELIFQLADLVDEDTELVGDVGNIVVAKLAPQGELLLS